MVYAGIQQGQSHIFQRTRSRQQVELLKHKANLLVAHSRQFVITHFGDIHAVEFVGAARRRIQTTQNRHERALARAGGAGNGRPFAVLDLQGDTVEGTHFGLTHLIHFGNILDLNHIGFLCIKSQESSRQVRVVEPSG